MGQPVSVIQAILRHKSPTTTSIYLHKLGLEETRGALEGLAARFADKHDTKPETVLETVRAGWSGSVNRLMWARARRLLFATVWQLQSEKMRGRRKQNRFQTKKGLIPSEINP